MMKKLNRILKDLFGLDFSHLIKIQNLWHFFKTAKQFRSKGGTINELRPKLYQFSNTTMSPVLENYFWQDLVVASAIFQSAPTRHITVGSRLDGFIAHVASFRHLEVIDIRPAPSMCYHNISFIQHDITQPCEKLLEATDSLSCLSTLHHLGTGRYGGSIDPDAPCKALNNMVDMLKSGGHLYIGMPIAYKSWTMFNENRFWQPKDILSWNSQLKLVNFDYVDIDGNLHQHVDIQNDDIHLPLPDNLSKNQFGSFGIYTFQKLH